MELFKKEYKKIEFGEQLKNEVRKIAEEVFEEKIKSYLCDKHNEFFGLVLEKLRKEIKENMENKRRDMTI